MAKKTTGENEPKRKRGGQPENKNAEIWTEEIALQLGSDLIKWLIETPENMYYSEYLTMERDIHPNIIGQMRDKFVSFRELIKKAKEIQKIKLIKYGTANKLNPAVTIFVLKNHHDMTDKRDYTSGGEKINLTPVQFSEDE